jgi:hypothetical protein
MDQTPPKPSWQIGPPTRALSARDHIRQGDGITEMAGLSRMTHHVTSHRHYTRGDRIDHLADDGEKFEW